MPTQFYLSAAHKSSGKTMVSLGLCRAFSKLGHVVQPFKKGLDYIDPIWLNLASQNPCFNLDFYTMTHAEIQQCYQDNIQQADVAIIEGNKGLYDGLSTQGGDSNADLAQLLDLAVVLVIDTTGITRGIAPLLQGYQNFDNTKISGVILNKVATNRHETKLIAAVAQYTDLMIYGSIRTDDKLFVEQRYLGLKPANEDNQAIQQINKIAQRVAQEVDLSALLTLDKPAIKINAKSAVIIDNPNPESNSKITLAVAKDKAFGFYYADDIKTFDSLGVDIVYFDTLNDKQLPNANALLIGGGFPEVYAQELANNQALLADIKQKITAGLPTYAECGGLMYLTRSIKTQNKVFEMVGVIKADTMMHQKPIGRGYVNLEVQTNHPWQHKISTLCAHEFHYASLINIDPDTKYGYKITRGVGIQNHSDGIIMYNLLASFAHFRHTKNNPWVKNFIEFIKTKTY